MSETGSACGRTFDVVVIGSGFGGAAVACRMAQAGRSVAVLELGREYPTGRGEVTTEGEGTPTVRHGHFWVDRGQGMSVIRGIGVGGGSLHYFGVRLRADPDIFQHPLWPREVNRKTLDPYYDLAGDMLHAETVQPNPVLGPPRRAAAFIDAARQCRRAKGEPHYVPIAVHTGHEPVPTPAGVPQTRCVYCGECLLGCPPSESFVGNVNARALLTLNYLAVARHHGALIFPEHKVERVRKTDDGFAIDIVVRDEAQPEPVRARRVVLAAGTLGSTEILLKSVATLPPLSPLLGQRFSGNGDFLIPKTVNTPQDLQPTSGPTIVAGADFSTENNKILIEDLGRIPFLEGILGLRTQTARTVNRHAIGYLGMGTDAGNGTMRLHRGRIQVVWDPQASMTLYDEIIAALREMSQQLGGKYADPRGYDPATGAGLFTAHPLGGCIMGETWETGVTDPRGEVHGVPDLWVADGALVCTALATNPSYTISALAERTSFWMLHGREMRDGDAETPVNR
jgi:cholesterol oxidase